MAFPGKLLSLSIKTQIIWTMVVFSVISVIFIYVIINLYIYEMKEENINSYIEYYYTTQKDIFQNIINFQNFFLFNYEDIIKTLICQLVLLIDISGYFLNNGIIRLLNSSFIHLNYSNITQNEYTYSNNSDLAIFYINNGNDMNVVNNLHEDVEFLKITFRVIKAFESFRIPYYGNVQLFEEVYIYLNKTKRIYSYNNEFLFNFINSEIGSDNLEEYFKGLKDNITNNLTLFMENILIDNTIYPELLLFDGFDYLLNDYKENKNIKIFPKFTPYLDYKKEYLHFIQTEEENNEIYVSIKLRSRIIDNILLEIMEYFNMTTILISPEDNSVINYMSCQALFIKAQFNRLTENKKKDLSKLRTALYKNEKIFINKKATIDKCLLGNEKIENEEYYNDYLIQYKSILFDFTLGYNSSFIQLADFLYGNEYMVTRFTYPDYNLLERKRPKYIILNSLTFYTFMNFYFPFSYVKDKADFLQLNFYAITLSNWFLWIILFLVIFLLSLKISRDITGPLIKLKKAIDQMSFNDEKIFEYKDDDNINELFAMCKELVNKDEFKKSLKEKTFSNGNKIVEEKENKSILNMGDNEQNTLEIRRGMTRNLILNNQIFEKNRKILNQENKTFFDKEILIYKDSKLQIIKNRPRNQSRKRPKTINKLITKNFDLDVPKKCYSRLQTKGDYNINSKIRDTFLRESLVSGSSKKISFNEPKLKLEKVMKNDNELNILLYELLFCLGKNMFKPNKDKPGKGSTIFKSDRTLISNNEGNNSNYNESNKNIPNVDTNNNKYYNYTDPIMENIDNVSDIIYEEVRSNSDIDRENQEKYLKEQYQINVKRNNLYYKYLKAKENWNNKFLKTFRNVRDLDLDSNAMVEIDDEEIINSLVSRKNLKRNDIASSRKNRIYNIYPNSERNTEVNILRISTKTKKSIIKNYNKKDKKKELRRSITSPINIFGREITNPRQKRLGMRASISNIVTSRNLGVERKRARFNIEKNND